MGEEAALLMSIVAILLLEKVDKHMYYEIGKCLSERASAGEYSDGVIIKIAEKIKELFFKQKQLFMTKY